MLLKYSGKKLLQFDKRVEVDNYLLCDIRYQGALTRATAHKQGIFPSGIKLKNIMYNGFFFNLIEFDTSNKWDRESLIKNTKSWRQQNNQKSAKAFCFPEMQYNELARGRLPIIPEKIDVYSWGMRMFFTVSSDTELENLTYKIKNSSWQVSPLYDRQNLFLSKQLL